MTTLIDIQGDLRASVLRVIASWLAHMVLKVELSCTIPLLDIQILARGWIPMLSIAAISLVA